MSIYAQQQDLYDRFGETKINTLADRDGDGLPDPGVIDAVLADADDLINAYVAVRFTLPLATLPPVLTRIGCNLARYELYADAAPAIVQARRDADIKLLQALAAGTATLGLDLPDQQASADTAMITPSAPPRTFDTETLDDYVNDCPSFP